MDTISAELGALLAVLDLFDDAMGLVLETLVSIASHDEGRGWVIAEYLDRVLGLVLLFHDKFDDIAAVGAQQGEAEDAGEGDGSEGNSQLSGHNARKVMGLFFRLYGALHEDERAFLLRLAAGFEARGAPAPALRAHLEALQNHPLLRDNDILDQVRPSSLLPLRPSPTPHGREDASWMFLRVTRGDVEGKGEGGRGRDIGEGRTRKGGE